MKESLPLFVSLLVSYAAFCQTEPDSSFNSDVLRGNRGLVYMKNGQKIPAFIDYSTYNGTLRVTAGQPLPKTMSASTIRSFEYFDEHLQQQRTFISHDFSAQEYNIEPSPEFFEVLKACDEFMLLERDCRINISQKVGRQRTRTMYPGRRDEYTHGQKVRLYTSQLDFICFLVNDEIKPYILYEFRELDDIGGTHLVSWKRKTNVSVLDKHLPETLLGDKFIETKKFARSKNLHWKDKNELPLILEHYDSLN